MARRGDFGDFGELREIKLPENTGRLIRIAILGFVVLVAIMTSFYTVSPEQIGVITRFGKFSRTTEPGLHFKLPFRIEQVDKVSVQRQLKQEFGFRTENTRTSRTRYSAAAFQDESLMLTGDLNAAEVEWVTQYRIVDPYKFLFTVRSVEETFRDMNEAVMRGVVGDRTVNEVLTVGRQEIAAKVEAELQALCEQYKNGLRVEQVVLQDVNPPEEVKPSFNEVNEAQQEKERTINQALAEYNRIIPKARGEALQTIQEAEGYYQERVNEARGDSSRFVSLFQAYERAPVVTRKRIYLETMSAVLQSVGRKVVMDESAQGVLPLLNLQGFTSRDEKEGSR
jgi:membrane protease subunit HflK